MFSQATLAELAARYPNLTADEIAHTARRVARKDREEPLNNPDAYLDRALRSMSERQPRSREHDDTPKSPKARGSFRADGSWDEISAIASDTETALRQGADTVVRLRLSPSDAVGVIENLPLVRACFRSGPVGVMLRLDAKPIPDTPGHDHGPLDWLHAAWHCTHTSTSAEEWVKRHVLFGIAKLRDERLATPQELPWTA